MLQTVAPETAAKAAAHLFFRTERKMKARDESRALFARAVRWHVPFAEQRLAVYAWGKGPTVLLSHGWNGRATQFASFVDPLVEAGARVVAFDHVGHGESSGDSTSIPEMARAARAVAESAGGVDAVIGHSLGAASSALALHDGLSTRRAVLISTPSTPLPWLDHFRSTLGLDEPTFQRTKRRIEERAGRRLEELVASHFVPSLDVAALIIHDRDDPQVPIASGRAVHGAWKASRFLETRSLGHNRILRSPTVVEAVCRFVTDDVA